MSRKWTPRKEDGKVPTKLVANGRKSRGYGLVPAWSETLKMNVGWIDWSQDSKYIYVDSGLSENPRFIA